MSTNARSRGATPSTKTPSQQNTTDTKSQETTDLFAKVAKLLQEGRPEKALEAIHHSRLKSPQVTNAIAVCQLRVGEPKRAAHLLHGLVAASTGVTLRYDVPQVYKTNYALALLLSGNVAGCLGVLAEIGDEQAPAVARLRAAVDQWKKGLSFWERMRWHLGDQPERPVTVNPPLGSLE